MRNIFFSLLYYYFLCRPKKGLNIIKSILRRMIIDIFYRNKTVSFQPVTFVFRMTYNCNLRCIQCGQWGNKGVYIKSNNKENNLDKEISAKEWIDFIKKNTKDITHIYFWGGEPLLKDNFMQIVKCSSKLSITTEISTNGTLLNKYAEDIVGSEVDYLQISIDGPREINSIIRKGEEDSYEKIIAGIERIILLKKKRKIPVPLVEICMTLAEENHKYIRKTYELAKNLHADTFHLQFGIFTSKDLEKKSSVIYKNKFAVDPYYWKSFVRDTKHINPEVIKEQIEYIREDVIAYKNITYRQTPPFDFNISDYFFKPEKILDNKKCLVPWQYIQIMPNGDIALCMDFPDLVGGNIINVAWKKIWNGPKFRLFREHILTEGIFPASSRCCTYFQSQPKVRLFSNHKKYAG